MVTPLLDRARLDCAGLERLTEHILDGGASAVFILGSTGEGPGLSRRLRNELVGRVCALAGGRVPVLVGITDPCFTESLDLASAAGQAGASAVVAAPPFYFPLSQPGLLRYVRRLAAEVPLPLFLYNMPAYTKLSFDPETVARAAGIPGVVGFKDSSGDLGYFKKVCSLLRGHPAFSLLMGPEMLLADALASGAHGGVCGGANLCPALFVKLYRAATGGDGPGKALLHEQVLRLGAEIYGFGEPESSYLRGLKSALAWLGICSGVLAEPLEAFGAAENEQVRQGLLNLGLIAREVPAGAASRSEG